MKQKSARELAEDIIINQFEDFEFDYDTDGTKFVKELEEQITAALENERAFFMDIIEEIKLALEFYASTSRWESTTHESTRDGIGCTDFQTFKCGIEGPIQFGGKTARAALEKLKERIE